MIRHSRQNGTTSAMANRNTGKNQEVPNVRMSKTLLAYTAAAIAGISTCTSQVEAEVVFTPIHSNIHGSFDLDLNHDGVNDFHIGSFCSPFSFPYASVWVIAFG